MSDIDIRTALGERLGRIRALNRALQGDDIEGRDDAHLRVMIDSEINAALEELEASDD